MTRDHQALQSKNISCATQSADSDVGINKSFQDLREKSTNLKAETNGVGLMTDGGADDDNDHILRSSSCYLRKDRSE